MRVSLLPNERNLRRIGKAKYQKRGIVTHRKVEKKVGEQDKKKSTSLVNRS